MDETDEVRQERLKRMREKQALWRAENREKDRAKVAAWAKANPEKHRERSRRYRAANRARINEQSRLRRATKHSSPEAKQGRIAKAAARAARKLESKERQRQSNIAWKARNPGRMQKLQKDWREANREKRRADSRGRKIAKRKTTIADLSKLQRGRCAICSDRLGADLHLDHIMPKKLGGSNARSNLQLTCPTCNMVKNAKHPLDHARSLGRLL